MRRPAAALLSFCFSACFLPGLIAQTADGDYHFLQLRVQGNASALTVGSLKVQAASAEFTARQAKGSQAAASVIGTAKLAKPDASTLAFDGLAGADLRVRGGQGVLLGTSRNAAPEHSLFLAVRKATTPPRMQGAYSGVYLRFNNGMAAQVETGHVLFEAAGTEMREISLLSHAANSDGVNRATAEGTANFTLSTDGAGTLRLTGKGKLAGAREMFVSGDGNLVIAAAMEGPDRDLMIAVRDAGGATEDALSGLYWIAEIGGTSPYAQQQASAVTWSSADGALFSFGTGRAAIAERVNEGGRPVDLTTAVRYRLGNGPERMMGPAVLPGVRNLALTDDMSLMVAGWVGREGLLTLEQGLLFGVKAAEGRLSVLNPGASAAPGALVTLYGRGLTGVETAAAAMPLPAELGGARATVNGETANLWMISPHQIGIQIPAGAKGATAAIEVTTERGAASITIPMAGKADWGAMLAVHADAQLVTPRNPAKPGEKVTLLLNGPADPEGPIVVLFNGIAAGAESAASTRWPGLLEVQTTVPDHKSVAGLVPLGLRTTTAFHDGADLSVQR